MRARSKDKLKGKNDTALAAFYLAWVMPAFIFLATFLVFSPALRNGFVNWDDGDFILGATAYRSLSWAHIRWMFGTLYMANYQPLGWLSYALDYRLWGLNPVGYHLTNILTHSASAVVFYFIGLQILGLTWPELLQRQKHKACLAAAFSALVFSLHPLRVESVVWASERRDVLCGFFYLLSLSFYLKAQAHAPRKYRWLGASWFSFLACMLSKGMGITLPFALILLDIYPLRRLSWNVKDWLRKESREVFFEKIPFLLLTVVIGWVGYAGQRNKASMLPWRVYGLGPRVAQASYGLMFYILKMILPIHLLPLYEMPPRVDLFYWPFALCAAAVVVVTFCVVLFRRSWEAGPVLWAFYAGTLVPVLGFVQFGPQITADRYSYLPCLGWALLAGYGLAWALNKRDGIRKSASAAAVIALFMLGYLSWKQTRVWRSSESLWRYELSLEPGSLIAHYDLGMTLAGREPTEAARQFHQALTLVPSCAQAAYDLANLLVKQGLLNQALTQYRRVSPRSPLYIYALVNAAHVLLDERRYAQCARMSKQAISLKPKTTLAYLIWGEALVMQGKIDAGISKYREALKIDPNIEQAYSNWGLALIHAGRFKEAIYPYQEALRLDPSSQSYRSILSALAQRAKEASGPMGL